jgi:Morc6 ribosomal protein S5 domain 2-like/CW-type Zinc Finger
MPPVARRQRVGLAAQGDDAPSAPSHAPPPSALLAHPAVAVAATGTSAAAGTESEHIERHGPAVAAGRRPRAGAGNRSPGSSDAVYSNGSSRRSSAAGDVGGGGGGGGGGGRTVKSSGMGHGDTRAIGTVATCDAAKEFGNDLRTPPPAMSHAAPTGPVASADATFSNSRKAQPVLDAELAHRKTASIGDTPPARGGVSESSPGNSGFSPCLPEDDDVVFAEAATDEADPLAKPMADEGGTAWMKPDIPSSARSPSRLQMELQSPLASQTPSTASRQLPSQKLLVDWDKRLQDHGLRLPADLAATRCGVSEARGHDWALGALASLVDTARDSARTTVRVDVWHATEDVQSEPNIDGPIDIDVDDDGDGDVQVCGSEPFLVLRDDGPGLDSNGMRRRLAAGTADDPPVPPPSASLPLSATPWLAACFRIGRDVCLLSKTAPSISFESACLSQHDRQLSPRSDSSAMARNCRSGSQHFALLSRTAIADGSLKSGVVLNWHERVTNEGDLADLIQYSPWNREEEIDEAFGSIGECGVLVAVFNLRRDPDDGELELDVLSDDADIILPCATSCDEPALRTSLRSYLQVLYLDSPEEDALQPRLYLRNQIIRETRIKDSLICPRDYVFELASSFHDECRYRVGLHPACATKVSGGWGREVYPVLNGDHGLLVYHCGRLIWPYMSLTILDTSQFENLYGSLQFNATSPPIVAVVEADMWTPTPNFQDFLSNDFYRSSLISLRQSLIDYLAELRLAGPHFGIDASGPAYRWIRCDVCGAWRILAQSSVSNMSDPRSVLRWTCQKNAWGTMTCEAPDDLAKIVPTRLARKKVACSSGNSGMGALKRSGQLVGVDPGIEFVDALSAKRIRHQESSGHGSILLRRGACEHNNRSSGAVPGIGDCVGSCMRPGGSLPEQRVAHQLPVSLNTGMKVDVEKDNALSPGILELDLNAKPESNGSPVDETRNGQVEFRLSPRMSPSRGKNVHITIPSTRQCTSNRSEYDIDLITPLFPAKIDARDQKLMVDVVAPLKSVQLHDHGGGTQLAAAAEHEEQSAQPLVGPDGIRSRLLVDKDEALAETTGSAFMTSAHNEAAVALVAMKAAVDRDTQSIENGNDAVEPQAEDPKPVVLRLEGSGNATAPVGEKDRMHHLVAHDGNSDSMPRMGACKEAGSYPKPTEKENPRLDQRDENLNAAAEAAPGVRALGMSLSDQDGTALKAMECNASDQPMLEHKPANWRPVDISAPDNRGPDFVTATEYGQPQSEGSKGPSQRMEDDHSLQNNGVNLVETSKQGGKIRERESSRAELDLVDTRNERDLQIGVPSPSEEFWRAKYLALVSSLVPELDSRFSVPQLGVGPDDADDLKGEVIRRVVEREEKIRVEAQRAHASEQIACDSLDRVRRLIRVFLERGVGIVRPEEDDDEPIESHFGAYLKMIDVLGANAEGFM